MTPPAPEIPGLDDYIAQATPLNPGYSEREIAAEYYKEFPAAKADLPSLPDFIKDAKPLNPDHSDEEIKAIWEDRYGAHGAKEEAPGFLESVGEGLKHGAYEVGASAYGTIDRLQKPGDPLKNFADDAADTLQETAKQYGLPEELAKQPWYQRLTDKQGLGNFIGDLMAQSAPSIGGAVVGGVAGTALAGPVGAIPGAIAGLVGSTYFQQAGTSYREAFERRKKDGASEAEAHEQAYVDSGIAGLVSGAVNALAVPASLVAPFKGVLKNLALQYISNIGVDTADQVTGNVVKAATYAPETKISEGVPEAVVGSALLGSGETMASIKSIAPRVSAEAPPSADPIAEVAPILKAESVDEVVAKAHQTTDSSPISIEKLDEFIGASTEEAGKQIDEIAAQVPLKEEEAQRVNDHASLVEILSAYRESTDDPTNYVSTDERGNTFFKGSPVDVLAPSQLPTTVPPESTELSQEKFEVVNEVMGLMGKRVALYAPGEELPDGVTWRSQDDSTIFLSSKTQSADLFSTAIHETFHLIEDTPFYEALSDVVWATRTDDWRAAAVARHGNYDDAVLRKEMISDIAGTELQKPEVLAKVYQKFEERVGEEQAQTEIVGVIDHLKAMIQKVKTLITSKVWSTGQKTYAELYVKDLTKVHDALAEVVAHQIYEVRAQKAKTLTPGIAPLAGVSVQIQSKLKTSLSTLGLSEKMKLKLASRTVAAKIQSTLAVAGVRHKGTLSPEAMTNVVEELSHTLRETVSGTSQAVQGELFGPGLADHIRTVLADPEITKSLTKALKVPKKPKVDNTKNAKVDNKVDKPASTKLAAMKKALIEKTRVLTPKDIHKLAEKKGLEWDNNPAFMALTKEVTGKEHLDDLTPAELQKMVGRLNVLNDKGILLSAGHPLASKSGMTKPDEQFAAEYDAAPVMEKAAIPAWKALKAETHRLYQEIIKKVTVERVTGQPYADAAAMNADIAKGTFKVTTDHSEHPLWTVDENVEFRVVHDYIGHFETGLDFSLAGERQAYEHHAAQLKDEAKPALKVEVYGQAAAAIAHDGEFQPQKIFLPQASRATVKLEHYSRKEDLTEISPQFHGTGQIGSEQKRMANEGSRYLKRSYFYRAGTKPEARFTGQTKYTTSIPAKDLVDLASMEGATVTDKELNAIEKGYQGFYNSDGPMPDAVAMFYPVKTDQAKVQDGPRFSAQGHSRTYEKIQKDIDAAETILDEQGVNISHLYDASDPQTSVLVGHEDWKPMPKTLEALYHERDAVEQTDRREFLKQTVEDSTLPKEEAELALKAIRLELGGVPTHFSETLNEWNRSTTRNLEKLYNHFAAKKYDDLEMHYAEFRWGGTGDKPVMTAGTGRGGRSLDRDILNKVELLYNAVGENIGNDPISLRTAKALEGPRFSPAVWFSSMGNVLNEKMPAKASKEQVQNILKSPGIKEDEVKWTGIQEYLDAQKGPIDKHNLMKWLEAHDVKVNEVVKGGKLPAGADDIPDFMPIVEFNQKWKFTPSSNTYTHQAFDDVQIDSHGKDGREGYTVRVRDGYLGQDHTALDIVNKEDSWLFDTFNAASEAAYEYAVAEPARQEGLDSSVEATQYEGYKLPGGTDYTELLLRLPDSQAEALTQEYNAARTTENAEKIAAHRAARTQYQSPHFDEPNILAHVRFDTRTDADGKTVLFLEEVQSDWAQQGLKRGYVGRKPADQASLAEVTSKLDALTKTPENEKEISNLKKQQRRLNARLKTDRYDIPEAPFEGSWPEMVMKRMLRWSAEHNYDRIAWTTGQQQSERYGLAQVVDSIEWTPAIAHEDLTGHISVRLALKNRRDLRLTVDPETGIVEFLEGRSYLTEALADKTFDEMVGQEIADKVFSMHHGTLRGEGLKMGGSGMKYFYDQMLPKFMEKYLKRFGTKVEATHIITTKGFGIEEHDGRYFVAVDDGTTNEDGYATRKEAEEVLHSGKYGEPIHSVALTPEMKDSVINRGQPMFSRNSTQSPAFKKWFGDSKVVDAKGQPLVVYHGTWRDFAAFDRMQEVNNRIGLKLDTVGHWFTTDSASASKYGPAIMPVYLSITKPLNFTGDGKQGGFHTFRNAVASEGGVEAFRKNAAKEGVDGVRISGDRVDGFDGEIYIAFEPTQIKSAISNRGTFDPKNPDIRFSRKPLAQVIPQAPPGKLDKIIRVLQDKDIDIKRRVEALRATGAKIADELNPVFAEEMRPKRDEQRARDYTNKELIPFINTMRLAKITQEQVDDYALARHIITDKENARLQKLNPDLAKSPEYDRLAGMTDVEAKATLAKLKSPAMDSLMARLDAMINVTRDMMIDYGLEDAKTIADWRSSFKAYVPLRREGFNEHGNPTGTGKSVRGSTVKQRGGSGLDVENVLANIAQARDQVITRGEKMRPVIAFAGLMMLHPDHSFGRLDKYAQIEMTDPVTGLKTLIPQGIGPYKVPTIRRVDPKSGVMQTYPDPMYKGRDNVVNFRIKGVDYGIIFNEHNPAAMEVAKAFKDADTQKLNIISQTIAPYTRYLAAINTQYNPIFGVVNFVRDAQFAMLTLSSTPLAGHQKTVLNNVRKVMAGIYIDARATRQGKVLTSPTALLYERFQEVGGPTGYRDLFSTAEDRAEEINRMLDPRWSRIRGLKDFGKKMEDTPLFEWLSDWNLMMENAMRLAVFKTAIDMGLSDIHGASLAKNATVNFNKKGQIGALMGSLYAFFNASVQGTARIAETLFERTPKGVRLSATGKKIVVGGLLIGVLQSVMLTLAGFDDDDPPEFVKQKNLIFPMPFTDKGYAMVPMPLGFNLLPIVGRLAAETVTRAIQGKPLNTMAKGAALFGSIFNTLSPTGGSGGFQEFAPTVIDPFVALRENRDWTGKAISKEDHSSLDPTPGHSRAHDTATIWAKGLSRMINWATGGNEDAPGVLSPTPDAIDYLIQQATGGVGREVSKTAQVVQSTLTGEELPPHKYPLAGRFMGSASGSSAVRTKFYENIREANIAYNQFEGRANRREPFSEFLKDHPEARFAKAAVSVQKDLSDLQKQKKMMIHRGENREAIKLQEMRITSLMKRFNDVVEKAQDQ